MSRRKVTVPSSFLLELALSFDLREERFPLAGEASLDERERECEEAKSVSVSLPLLRRDFFGSR